MQYENVCTKHLQYCDSHLQCIRFVLLIDLVQNTLKSIVLFFLIFSLA